MAIPSLWYGDAPTTLVDADMRPPAGRTLRASLEQPPSWGLFYCTTANPFATANP